MSEGAAFQYAGAAVLRATTAPPGLAVPEYPNTDFDRARAASWLTELWGRPDLREAVQLASPALARDLDRVTAGEPAEPRKLRRLVRSLASYVLRWQGRATPFGLFAGVAPVGIGTEPVVRWGVAHRPVARPDAEWLGEIVGRLERQPDLFQRLTVVTNNAASIRGDRIVIPGRPPDGPGRLTAPLEMAVRHTRVVRSALAAARSPVTVADLVKLLAVEFPAVPLTRIGDLVAELAQPGFLLTSLRAPMTVSDPLAHLVAELDRVDPAPPLLEPLREIGRELDRHNQAAAPDEATAARARAAGQMRSFAPAVTQPVRVDLRVDCDVTVPETVIREAEAAATMLLRLTPYPFGQPRWKEFHGRFRRRYGIGVLVPVLDLIADSGLGLPAGYLGSDRQSAPRLLTGRDEALLALAQQAAMGGADEVVLDDAALDALAVARPDEVDAPARVELAFQVLAASTEELARGAFGLVVTGAPRPASSMVGRFADLLPARDRDRLAATFDLPDELGAVAAHLSFPPRVRRDENVSRTPPLLPRTIAVSEHRDPDPAFLGPADLAVTADPRHLHLVQISTGRPVAPRVAHALEAGGHTPPLARFLAEVATARSAVYSGFDWGAARRLPFLPRVRRGRTVLCPARWLLAAADLPPREASQADWDQALVAWRAGRRLPDSVAIAEGELRLPVDLDQAFHRALLRSRVDRAGGVELRETPPAAEFGWLGRPHEVVAVLKAQPAPRLQPAALPRKRSVRRTAGELPGRSAVLRAQIHGHPARQDEILTGHLAELFGLSDVRLGWFVRERDLSRPDVGQRIGLYLRLASADRYGEVAGRLADWAAHLGERGLVPDFRLVPHYPDEGRFGHGAAMAAAEGFFAADSALALTLIAMAGEAAISREAVTAVGLVDLVCSFAAARDGGLRWLVDHLPQEHGRVDPTVRTAAVRLAAGVLDGPGALDRAGRVSWWRRREALAAYREALADQREPGTVLRSLLHLHHVRVFGVDPDAERVTHRLARSIALSHLHRERAVG